jgi:hypothetical protein
VRLALLSCFPRILISFVSPLQLFKQLLEVESSPLSLEDCRHSSSIITRLRVQAAANRLPAAYNKPLAQAMLGVLRIRFSLLWDAARDALAALLQVKLVFRFCALTGKASNQVL